MIITYIAPIHNWMHAVVELEEKVVPKIGDKIYIQDIGDSFRQVEKIVQNYLGRDTTIFLIKPIK